METIQAIMDGCKQGDRLSQEKLYRQFYPGLFTLCRQFFEEPHDVLTALNNGMLKVFAHLDQYSPAKGTLFNWVYSIVRNEALTYLRNKKYTRSIHELTKEQEFTEMGNPFKAIEWKDIYAILSLLKPVPRAVCALYYIEGLLVKEISEQMQLSEGTVKWHLAKSREQLKPYFLPQTIKNSA